MMEGDFDEKYKTGTRILGLNKTKLEYTTYPGLKIGDFGD